MEKSLIPGLVNPQYAYRNILRSRINSNTRWLDLGCGHKLFSNSLPDSKKSQHELIQSAEFVAGIDGDSGALKMNEKIPFRIIGDIQKLPFRNNSFNLVTANMVVEHVPNPHLLLCEINRILEEGGYFIFHTPNALNYKIMLARAFPEFLKKPVIKYLHNRGEDDIYPTRYRLNRPKIVKEAAKISRFDLKDSILLQGPADSVMLGPLVIFELLLMKILSLDMMRNYQSNMIVLFKKEICVDAV